MAEKVIFASGKGGVGKSTMAGFLGDAMARRDWKVLLIDADFGLGALDLLLGVGEQLHFDAWDVLQERCGCRDALINVRPGLDLLGAPTVLTGPVPEDAFERLCAMYESDYDAVFIDGSAGLDGLMPAAARACGRAVVVATADAVSVKAAAQAAAVLEDCGIAPDEIRLVINRFQKKAAMKSRLLHIDGVIDRSGVRLLGIVPEDRTVPFLSVTGERPKQKSAFMSAIGRVADRMTGLTVPLNLRKL